VASKKIQSFLNNSCTCSKIATSKAEKAAKQCWTVYSYNHQTARAGAAQRTILHCALLSPFWVLLIFCYLAFNSFDQIGAETERLLGWEWPQPWHSTCAKTLLLLIQAVALHRVQLYSLKGPHSDVTG